MSKYQTKNIQIKVEVDQDDTSFHFGPVSGFVTFNVMLTNDWEGEGSMGGWRGWEPDTVTVADALIEDMRGNPLDMTDDDLIEDFYDAENICV